MRLDYIGSVRTNHRSFGRGTGDPKSVRRLPQPRERRYFLTNVFWYHIAMGNSFASLPYKHNGLVYWE